MESVFPRRHTQDNSRGAVINGAVLHAKAPVDVVVGKGAVGRRVVHVVIAEATAAGGLAAAVVVGNDVVQVVGRVPAGADPGHRVHAGARGAGIVGAAAATAEEAVDGAIAPVVAGCRIARVGVRFAAGLRRDAVIAAAAAGVRGPGNGQQRYGRAAGQGQSYAF